MKSTTSNQQSTISTVPSRIIDLTLPLRPGMRGFEMEPKFLYARDGWNASTLHLYSHCGTHMDAQVHFEAGPETIDQHTPDRCMGAAWVVELSGIAPKGLIEIASLGPVAEKLQSGESLLLRTDWSKHVNDPALYRDGLPRISESLARWCVEKRVKLLGVEPPSVADVNNRAEVTLIHKLLLGGGVTIVEGLTNLDQLREPQVFFIALPLKPLAGDGSPCRALAIEGISPDGWLGAPPA
jgi:kynurenine formamidase